MGTEKTTKQSAFSLYFIFHFYICKLFRIYSKYFLPFLDKYYPTRCAKPLFPIKFTRDIAKENLHRKRHL